MITKEEFLKDDTSPLINALKELDKKMQENNIPPIELNVIGGFAMIMNEDRERDGITDIDYVGPALSDRLNTLAEPIGESLQLPKGWLNNDTMVSGSTLEDFELSSGPINFAESIDLDRIKINIADRDTLLRLKVIAIDTAAMGVEMGGEFTRLKDFADIKRLMEETGRSIKDLDRDYGEYIENPNTLSLINTFNSRGMDETLKKIEDLENTDINTWDLLADEIGYDDISDGRASVTQDRVTGGSFLDQILDNAIAAVQKEQDEKRGRLKGGNNRNDNFTL